MAESPTKYLERRIDGGTINQLTQFPRYFEIETINACNARCPMCTISDWERTPSVMKDELFEKIASEICEHPEVKRVHLYRDGEPLLDKKLASRIRRLKTGGVRRVGISTNVELLTADKAEAILSAGIDEVILSIDSMSRDVYSKIRVGLNLDTVVRNAINFFSIRNWLGSNCNIRVRMIRQESNYNEWPVYRRAWQPRLTELDTVEYRDIHNWGSQLEGFKPVAAADTGRPCIALWSLMVIFVDGTVPLCNVDYNGKHPLGNVKDTSIADLWESIKATNNRQMHILGYRDEMPLCKGCTVWSEKQ